MGSAWKKRTDKQEHGHPQIIIWIKLLLDSRQLGNSKQFYAYQKVYWHSLLKYLHFRNSISIEIVWQQTFQYIDESYWSEVWIKKSWEQNFIIQKNFKIGNNVQWSYSFQYVFEEIIDIQVVQNVD